MASRKMQLNLNIEELPRVKQLIADLTAERDRLRDELHVSEAVADMVADDRDDALGDASTLEEQRDAALARAEQAEQQLEVARTSAIQEVIDAIKVRREHHIACGTDLSYLGGLYEAVKVAQKIDGLTEVGDE